MTLLTGWCITGDCDQDTERGGCPVRVADNPPCPCACHGGATAPRGFLASRKLPPSQRNDPQPGTEPGLPAAA